MSEKEIIVPKKVTWQEIQEFEQNAMNRGGFTERDRAIMFMLVKNLDESTRPGEHPPGFLGD